MVKVRLELEGGWTVDEYDVICSKCGYRFGEHGWRKPHPLIPFKDRNDKCMSFIQDIFEELVLEAMKKGLNG